MADPCELQGVFNRLTLYTTTGTTRTGEPVTRPFVSAPNALRVGFTPTFIQADVRCGDTALVGGRTQLWYIAPPGTGAALIEAWVAAGRSFAADRRLATLQSQLVPLLVLPEPRYVTRMASAARPRRSLAYEPFMLDYPGALVRLGKEWLHQPIMRRRPAAPKTELRR
ncbi:hypothetical protein [Lacticaseibacillus parakribbianus]|uniref:hypothetical protein n=1 Tax=Lacticaseibacillus parakribbianus TaxID=2970927 RepID=UPI0021CB1D4D|nr:hypothetical protein [Lacticaseibacillus parakribbianus]